MLHLAAPTVAGASASRSFVVLHGIGMAGNTFVGLAERLSAEGEVWAPDMPGFGDSPERPTPLSIPQTADLLARWMLVAGVRTPVTLVGHSMGTQVAAEICVRHPQLVDRLVLMAPTVDASARSATAQALRMADDLRDDSLRVLGLGLANYVKVGPKWFADKLGIMLDHRIEQVLPDVRVPTLVLRGSEDRVCPDPWVRHCAQLTPGASFVQLPGVGHETMIANPALAAQAILDFLRATDAANAVDAADARGAAPLHGETGHQVSRGTASGH
nr:alpha/beta hydrolase [Pseudoclavibacter sp. 13-3]